MAVGDAALALDPISSQEIFFSLYSGIHGAETIAAIVKDGLQNAHVLYRKKIENVFLANQKSRRHFILQNCVIKHQRIGSSIFVKRQ